MTKKKKKKIEYLLEKYKDDVYVKGEYESSKQHQLRDRGVRLKKRLLILNDLLMEEPKLNLTCTEKERVQYLIEKYYFFKELYHRVSDTTIILAFIFYVKIDANSRINFHEWRICRKYHLTLRKYAIIITRLFSIQSKNKPLAIKSTTRYNHSILEKESL